MDPRKLYWLYIQFIRSKIRPFMRPMSLDEAQEKRELFAKLYFTSACLTLAYCIYKVGKENINFDYGTKNPSSIDMINKLNIKGDVKVIRFDGFKKVDEYIYNKDRPNEIIRTSKPIEENTEVLVE